MVQHLFSSNACNVCESVYTQIISNGDDQMTTLKFCRCCGTKAFGRKRVCPTCKVPAIWDKATAEQAAAHKARRDDLEALLQELLAEEA
jgi:ribosomal protein L37E